jgi:hypothetical protein
MLDLIYDYLNENCVGYENRVKSDVLMKEFGIKDNKTFRNYIQELRQNPNYENLVGSEAGSSGGYFIVSNYQEFKTTVEHHYLRAMEMLKTYGIMKNKYYHKDYKKLEV